MHVKEDISLSHLRLMGFGAPSVGWMFLSQKGAVEISPRCVTKTRASVRVAVDVGKARAPCGI